MAPRRPKGAGAFPRPVESPAPQPPDPSALYAALDLGTNSCRMLIAQPKGSGFHVVDSFSKSVQLGHGLEKTGRLSRASMGRTGSALHVCRQKIERHKVTRMRLVATEACRRARNAREFIRHIQRETGLKGLGQVLKSFRDREADFSVYDRSSGTDAYLKTLGPLAIPQQGSQAGVNTADPRSALGREPQDYKPEDNLPIFKRVSGTG